MKLKDFFEMDLVREDARIWIREFRWRNGECTELSILDTGYKNQDCIQRHREREVECFVWQDDNQYYIDLKE